MHVSSSLFQANMVIRSARHRTLEVEPEASSTYLPKSGSHLPGLLINRRLQTDYTNSLPSGGNKFARGCGWVRTTLWCAQRMRRKTCLHSIISNMTVIYLSLKKKVITPRRLVITTVIYHIYIWCLLNRRKILERHLLSLNSEMLQLLVWPDK